jgi:hypothetical protein
MQNATPDFLAILRTLSDYKVDFIVVGGVCAVLHGAPLATFDLDVVHCRSADNLDGFYQRCTPLTRIIGTGPASDCSRTCPTLPLPAISFF